MSSVKKYKCLNCHAGLEFNPVDQNWKCDYCLGAFSIEQVENHYKYEGNTETLSDEDIPDLDSYSCNSCGAELIADDTVSSTFCLYCRNPTIIKNRFSGKFKPKFVIPFHLTKENAQELYSKWIKKRIFAPKAFKQREEIDKITGIYAPYWLFNCATQGSLNGTATKIRTWHDSSYTYTETSHYSVSRQGNSFYSNVPIDGSKKLDDSVMEKVEPYDYSKLTNFGLAYMSGFMAEKYDVDSEAAATIAEKRINKFFKDRLSSTIVGYNSFREEGCHINLEGMEENYAMLPIYLLVNHYKDKEHVFIVNGQTGKVVGDTPIDKKSQALFFAIVTAATFIITLFGGALLG